jgi:acyl-CoA synthetase (AMP-forming)/AMP-acid ligase II
MRILNSSETLWDRLVNRCERTSLHSRSANSYEGATWDRVVLDAEQMTAGLRDAGVEPGGRVAAILGNTAHTARGVLGVWLAGGVLASLPPPHSDYQGTATEAAAVSMAKAAVAIDECVFLERDALPKTPSGKIQRHRCHALIRAGSFEPLATIRLDDH